MPIINAPSPQIRFHHLFILFLISIFKVLYINFLQPTRISLTPNIINIIRTQLRYILDLRLFLHIHSPLPHLPITCTHSHRAPSISPTSSIHTNSSAECVPSQLHGVQGLLAHEWLLFFLRIFIAGGVDESLA